MIACVRIQEFAATLERRDTRTPAEQPLILTAHHRVYATSSDAEQLGVQPGMAVRPAHARCPHARVLPARPGHYRQVYEEIVELLEGLSPPVEPDEELQHATCYVELGQFSRAATVATVKEIGQAVRERFSVAPSIGVARGKFPARAAAASVAPSRALYVAPGRETALLAPLPVETLPLDAETTRRLRLLGIQTLGQFAALPAGAVLSQFGREGRRLHQLAQGCDNRPLRPRFSRPSEQVAHHFDNPIADRLVLEAVTHNLAALLAGRLQARAIGVGTLWLTLDLEDNSRYERRRILRESLAAPEPLAQALVALLKQVRIRCGVVMLQALATDLTPLAQGARQPTLFNIRGSQTVQFQEAVPALIARHGADRFFRVTPGDQEAVLLEQRFRLHAAHP